MELIIDNRKIIFFERISLHPIDYR